MVQQDSLSWVPHASDQISRIFVWPAISIEQGMMIYPTPAMQAYTLARNSYLLHLY